MNDDWWLWRPNNIREPYGPRASWHLSYRWGKTPKKPRPGNLSRPGIESGPTAWQACMLPPGPQCLMELIFKPCGEFRWSPEDPVSQIHSPHLLVGAPGIFSDLLRFVQMLQREWSAESNGKLYTYSIPCKTAALVPEFVVENLPLAELQPRFLRVQWRTCHSDDDDDEDDSWGSPFPQFHSTTTLALFQFSPLHVISYSHTFISLSFFTSFINKYSQFFSNTGPGRRMKFYEAPLLRVCE